MTEHCRTGGNKTESEKNKRNGASSYLQGKALLCRVHCGLTVVRVQVQQMVICCTAGPEEEKISERTDFKQLSTIIMMYTALHVPWKPTKNKECFGLPPMIPMQHCNVKSFYGEERRMS